uniref:Uncharacterized protein n=1 Tax=Anguilla anguilla TaxID=7936 RepID=A0A0E9QNQ2_ANGAN
MCGSGGQVPSARGESRTSAAHAHAQKLSGLSHKSLRRICHAIRRAKSPRASPHHASQQATEPTLYVHQFLLIILSL